MLAPLYIKAGEDFPKVTLDKEKEIIEFVGRALMEDAIKFFSPILKWGLEYIAEPNPKTEIIFKLEYFNSSSAKQIVELLVEFETLHEQNADVKILWHFCEGDELMRERGEEIENVIELPYQEIVMDVPIPVFKSKQKLSD